MALDRESAALEERLLAPERLQEDGGTRAQLTSLSEQCGSHSLPLPVGMHDDLCKRRVEDAVAEESGKPDEPPVGIRRMNDAKGIGERRPNAALVVVVSLTPADGAVECDDVCCLGPLPD